MADLIDRDAAYDAIGFERCDRSCTDCPTKCTWFYTVKNIPAGNRWIPCSEMLPENNVPVLYVWRCQNGAVAVLHGWHFEIRSLGSAWHQSGVGLHRPEEEVTHWMPLPEPPESEVQNDDER